MNWEEVWKLLRNFRPELNRQIWYRCSILDYEAGAVFRDYDYSLCYPDEEKVHLADMRREVGDVIAQTQMLCCRMGWNYEEVENEGKKRVLEVIAGKR